MREGRRRGGPLFFAGLDLAGSPSRETGVAVLGGCAPCRVLELSIVYTDEEILGVLERYRPAVLAIDAPLTSSAGGYRMVDIEAKKLGFRLLPPSWRGMRMLTMRGIRLAELLTARGFKVVETHPRSALLSAGCRPEEWARCLDWCVEIGEPGRLRRHVVDALVSACVAYQYHLGQARIVSAEDGEIVLLSPTGQRRP